MLLINAIQVKKKNRSPAVAGFILGILVQSPAQAGSLSLEKDPQLKDVGRIVGSVRLEGHFEKPGPLPVYKNRDFCGPQVPNESLLVGPRRGLQNVVLIISGAGRVAGENQVKNLVLDNKNCAFVPHVQVAPVGSEILLLNSDPILHDVHARLGSETLFNEGLPTWRQVKKRLTRTGIVTIQCEVLHTWMSAYIVVTSSPYFAVTDKEGAFVIEGVPAGTHKIEVWHEKLGKQSKNVTVVSGDILRTDFVYRLDKRGT
ncbi:MAG TPA: carboxypeptidase regulatory-like domain-containing protein [Candidatus Binatia bacterium]|nr:carboxypeptidase regulatory-like domain-containing protein [Candidatus Binatia bacterium]